MSGTFAPVASLGVSKIYSKSKSAEMVAESKFVIYLNIVFIH